VRSIITGLIVFLFQSNLSAQCFESNFAFGEGEVLKYEVYYNLKSIWLNAGHVEFSVKNKNYKGQSVYHLDSYGATYESYDWIFKVRDHYQGYLDKKTLSPVWFHRQNNEGDFQADYEYEFDHKQKEIYTHTWNSKRPERRDTIPLRECTFDVISLIYYARNLKFSDLEPGDSIPVRSFIDSEYHNLFIRYLGKDKIETKAGYTYRCIKFSALLVEGTMFKGGENLIVWVSDDKNRIPVLVEAKILVGSIKAFLKETEGLQNEQESLLMRRQLN
jgi:hypothetical protein